jgi:hypothetical protein
MNLESGQDSNDTISEHGSNVLSLVCIMDTAIVPPGKHGELGDGTVPEIHDQCTDHTCRRADSERLKLPALDNGFAVNSGGCSNVQRGCGLLAERRAGSSGSSSSRIVWHSANEGCKCCEAGDVEEGEMHVDFCAGEQ